MDSVIRAVRRFVLEPAAFFADNPPRETLPVAIFLLVLSVIVFAGGIVLLGSMASGAIDETVTVDNPDRPPEWVCDTHAEEMPSSLTENCDEPATVERDAGALLQEGIHSYLWLALLAPAVLWVGGGIVLYVAGRVAGGTPSFSGTFSLAGWALIPEFVRLAVALVVIRTALLNTTVTDIEQAPHEFEAAMAPLEPVLLIASLAMVVWQWHLLTGGLMRDADLSRAAAAVATGVPLGLLALLSLS